MFRRRVLKRVVIVLLSSNLFLFACEQTLRTIQSLSTPLATPNNTTKPIPIKTPLIPTVKSTSVSATLDSISCDNWQAWPIIPVVSQTSHEVYERGLSIGNDPHSFSKVGDGEISTAWFLTAFGLSNDYYDLGEYQSLMPVIENFQGSFERIGFAARSGFNTNLILDPTSNNNSSLCNENESPLDCELRLHKPSIAIFSLGTNQVWQSKQFETGLRRILDFHLSNGVLPILSTKGDNLEGDHRINRTITCLAQEYDIPLWNFWAAIQPLPDQGLQPDLEHLTYYGINDFNNPDALKYAWTIRNLTALQTLDAVWRSVSEK